MSNDSVLKDLFRKWPYSDQCRKDAARLLQTYRDLRPEKKKFVYNDGQDVDLVALNGTIPVMYKGTMYNIPICIWLQENHPFIPPLVYVVPTTNMAIRAGKHVDQNGRVYLPFLHEWQHPRSDLAAMVQILCCVFAEQPPVYSRATPAPVPPPTQGPPSYGYPHQGPLHGSFPNTTNTPYPNRGPTHMPYAMPGPGAGRSPVPYPSYPPNVGSNPPYPGASQPYRPPSFPTPPATSSPTTAANAYRPPAQPVPPGPAVTASAASVATKSARPLSSQSSISEDMIKSSLVSAVEDKLRRQIRATFEQAQIEQNELMRTQKELRRGSEKLEDMLQKLQKEQDDVNNNIKLLTQKNDEIAEIIGKLESESSELDIDESVITTAPLYNQILNLFAEENAVEDTIYYLSEGLRKEAISVEVFLKHVRTLSRKQFMLRALLQKARKTAGLG